MRKIEGLSVVIPALNAEATLPAVTSSLADILPELADSYEVILVNDGSGCASWSVIESLAAANPWIRGIDLARRYGQHNATLAGIRAARHPVIVTMDADGQHVPGEIGKMLVQLEAGKDLIYGYPEEPRHGGWRNVITALVKWLCDASGLFPGGQHVCGFRAFRTRLRESLAQCHTSHVSLDAMLRWGTNRVGFVAVRHRERQGGQSSYSIGSLYVLVMDALTAHSVALVQLVELTGVAMLLLGACGVLTAIDPTPWLAGIVFVAAGIVTIAVGIVGEYSARTYQVALGEPQVFVRTDTWGDK